MLLTVTRTVLLTLLLAVDAALASPVRARTAYAVKDSHVVPSRWRRVGPAPADHWISLQIGLKQSQFDELERHLYEVSDPSHHRYGQHLSASEVDELVKPADDTSELVHDWLLDNGIDRHRLEYNSAKNWIKVTLPVNAVERLLDTNYSVYKHDEGDFAVRTPKWSLPLHLHEHIETIQPTNSFFRPAPLRSTLKPVMPMAKTYSPSKWHTPNNVSNITVAQACNASAVTPLCLRTLYGTYNYTPKVPGLNKVGLTDYLGETNNRSDVYLFLQQFRPDAVSEAYTFTFDIIADGSAQQTPDNATQLDAGTDLEGNLDAETIIGIDYPTPLIAFTTGGSPPFNPDAATTTDTNEPYLTWLNAILNQTALPQTISTSYGDDEQTVPYAYATTVCKQFAQLGARGITLLFASGDNGVGPTGRCFSNDGKNSSIFLPSFPASCPYITAVGATKNFGPEVVAYDPRNNFASGAGFSNYFPRPSYQDAVVPAYISSLNGSYAGLFNASGRGYPDIAAQGYHFLTVWNGTIVTLDGTSASTPTAAAVLSLVNDALLARGRAPLGWLNPWLYAGGYKAFTDVTMGSAIGCGVAGFPAAVGWDAVTGWGTPYFPKLERLALEAGGGGYAK
ncbi:MAG: hypothetical protein LQ347_004015 [Umbilicaria vellea]|nr:MAG: hypothetical protein LQ347_004015 [Umbilicaria vellea]